MFCTRILLRLVFCTRILLSNHHMTYNAHDLDTYDITSAATHCSLRPSAHALAVSRSHFLGDEVDWPATLHMLLC
jgi:hypothetical protein